MVGKFALLIGVSEYADGLNPLPCAVRDVEALGRVLQDPQIGGFDDVKVLSNPVRQDMADRMYEFLSSRKSDDLLLLFFSGHGVVDKWGKFYLANQSTRKQQDNLMPTTAVAASEIQGWMANSPSRRQLIILDCCFAGAFAKGITAKGEEKIDIRSQLGGEGRAILTAATSTQSAFEQEGFELSIYSRYLVEGLATGAADLDNDGQISVEELHEYVFKKVKEAAPAMTPEIYNLARDTEPILIARSPKDDPQLKYRKEVRKLAEEDEGDFSFINRRYLNKLGKTLGLDSAITQNIEVEELEPYRQRKEKEAEYYDVFEGAIQHRYPLTEKDRNGLKRLQQLLSLRDEDVNQIEQAVLSKRQLLSPQPTQPSEPQVPADDFASEKGIDYTRLRDLLAAGSWRDADQETYRVMIRAVGKEEGKWFTEDELRNFPCVDLKTIDQLWVKYSNGHFGFSVQKKIWQECGSPTTYNENWEKFGDRVGWRKDGNWLNYNDLTFNLDKSLAGELPGWRGGGGLCGGGCGLVLAQRLVDCNR